MGRTANRKKARNQKLVEAAARRLRERKMKQQNNGIDEARCEEKEVQDNNADELRKLYTKLKGIALAICNPGKQKGRKTKGINAKRDKMVAKLMAMKNNGELCTIGIVQKLPGIIEKIQRDIELDDGDYMMIAKTLLRYENTKKTVVFMTEQQKQELVHYTETGNHRPEFITDAKSYLARQERYIVFGTPSVK